MSEKGTVVPGEIEAKASKMGWVPLEQFKGDPERWVEAERFVERGENEIPIMRERYKKLGSTVEGLEKTIEEMNGTFAQYRDWQNKVEEKAYKKALADLTAQQRAAVKDGDQVAFDAIEVQKAKLPKPEKIVAKAKSPAADEFESWKTENKWYLDDKDLQAYAVTVANYVQAREKLPDGRKLFDAIKEEVKLRFPEKFENPNRNKPNKVVGDGEGTPPKGGGGEKTFADLPKDAQAMCNKFMKTIPNFTKKEYIDNYEWE